MSISEKKYSIIIPVHNEEKNIFHVISGLYSYLNNHMNDYEIIIVNDGSTDKTREIISQPRENMVIYNNPYNKGYGSSLKKGSEIAEGKYLIFYDGDGQHNPEDILKLIKYKNEYEMVVGSRRGYQGPLWRQPGKKIINIIANYLVRFRIPDLNSGLRLVKKECFKKFEHLYPNGFSLSTTITLAFIKHGFNVKYVPIKISKREGSSTVKITDGFLAINLVIRMIMLFSPLRIFVPVGLALFALAFYSLCRDLFVVNNINDNTVLLIISSLIVFFFGLIADQLAHLRREMKL